MQNPSYLIRSRHAIYYFRYPIPEYGNGRLSISLNTRCPKEALRLSKVLEYHAFMVMSNTEIKELDYIEVKGILRDHFAEVVERWKRAIDKDGALSEENLDTFKQMQTAALEAIENKVDELHDTLEYEDEEDTEAAKLDSILKPIVKKHDVFADKESKEYAVLRREYKHAYSRYIAEVLAYSSEGDAFYSYAPAELKGINSSSFFLFNLFMR